MATVTIHEAKTQLSKLIARVEAGEDIIIARGKEPVARLTSLNVDKKRCVFGSMAGQFPPIPDAFFFDPLPDDELAAWEGASEDPAR